MYGTYAAPTSKTKKVLQKTQCITKGAAKSTDRRTAKCYLLHGFFMYSITKSKVLLKKNSGVVLHPYIPTYWYTTSLHRCCKSTNVLPKVQQKNQWRYTYIFIYIYIHIYVLALHPYRCCNVSPKVLQKVPTSVNSTGAAKVPVHHMSTIAAPPHRTPGFPKERKERMKHLLLQCPGAFFGMSWILVRRPSHDLHVFSIWSPGCCKSTTDYYHEPCTITM